MCVQGQLEGLGEGGVVLMGMGSIKPLSQLKRVAVAGILHQDANIASVHMT